MNKEDKREVLRLLGDIQAKVRRISVMLEKMDRPIFRDREVGEIHLPSHVKDKMKEVCKREKNELLDLISRLPDTF